jgi:hypothetical protein
MADEPILIAPVAHHIAKRQAAEAAQQAQPRLATAEEIRASDQLFANQQQEEQLVAGLIGMYTGTILLRDLAAEHLSRDRNEELNEAKEPDTAEETQ